MAAMVPEFLALTICETVIEDKATGNRSVINIFNRIHAIRFPAVHPKLTIFGTLSGLHGQVAIRIRLSRMSDDRELFSAEGQMTAADPLQAADLVFNLIGIQFQSEGTYAVELFGNGTLLATRKFQVVKTEGSK